MPLNKTKGNMYDWITHTWNTVKGKCPHGCSYCYMKKWGKQPEVRFDEKELKTDLGKNNTVFVGSSCDLFADGIPFKWILDTLQYCNDFPHNRYLFQSKNPRGMYSFSHLLPINSIVGTTIESSDSNENMGCTPTPESRSSYMVLLRNSNFLTMVTIEPIMEFDLERMIPMIQRIKPRWVNIGANTNTKVKLTEPSPEKVKELIAELEKFTEVKIKKNLYRLIK